MQESINYLTSIPLLPQRKKTKISVTPKWASPLDITNIDESPPPPPPPHLPALPPPPPSSFMAGMKGQGIGGY